LVKNQQAQSSETLFLCIPLWRLIVLSIVTCKLYEVYWFYKNWRCIKERNGESIKPFWRALLGIFFVHRLLGRMHNDREANVIQKPSFSPRKLATVWLILVIVQMISAYIPGTLAIFIAALIPTFLCLLPVQRYINEVEEKRNGVQPSHPWSRGHIILIAIGIIYWILLFTVVISNQPKPLSKFDKIGGVSLILEVNVAHLTKDERSDAIEETVTILKERIKSLGTVKAYVERYSYDDIRVLLPGVYDKSTSIAVKSLMSVTQLSFHVVIDDREIYQKALDEGVTERYMFKLLEGETNEKILIEKKSVMDGRTLKDTSVIVDEMGRPAINMNFDAEGKRLFAQITRENIDRRLAILIRGEVLSAPLIMEEVPGGNVMISGYFTDKEAQSLAETLRAGTLPAAVEVVQEEVVWVESKK